MKRVICLFVLLALSATMWGQGTTSRITGIVTDQTGAVVSGATVTATNEGTKVPYTTTSSSSGVFVFDSLQIGTYTISAEAKGFKKFVSTGNVLSIGSPTTVNCALQVGSSGEVVEVKGGYELVQTETSGNFGTVIDNKALTQLAIVGLRARNPLSLVFTVPGVQDGGGNQTGGGISVHGSRDRAWNYTLDGIDVNESTSGGSNTTPTRSNPDSLAEIQVITSNFTPEYGRNSGGQVVQTTKSGTNNLHGTAFWFYQSPFLQANDAPTKAYQIVNKKPNVRSQFVQNIPGGAIGGPIIKNKTFFFANVQLLHARNSYLQTSTVFTDMLKKQGIFRYVQGGGRNGPYGSTNASVDANGNPIPGLNIATYNIPTNDPGSIGLDPAIQKYLALEPSPNNFTVGDGLNTAGYTFVAPQLEKQVEMTYKVDHVFSAGNAIFVRWYQGHQNTFADSANGGLQYFPGMPNVVDTYRKPRNLAINWRWSPTPRTTNEFVIGDNYFGYEFTNPDPNLETNPPFIFNSSPGVSLISVPLSSWVNNNRYANTYQLVDNFTWVKNAHTIKTGVNLRYLREIDHRGSIGNLNAEPQVYFYTGDNPVDPTLFKLASNCPTSGTMPATCIYSGDRSVLQSAVNILLGRVGEIQQGYVSTKDMSAFQPARTWNIMDHRWPEYDFYVQDSWKLKPNLTVDYGVRWEIRIAPKLVNFQDLVPNQSVVFGQTPSETLKWVPGSFYKNAYKNIGPSIGLAWDPFKDGKTSIRAHYRIAYDRINPFSFSSSVFQGMPGLTYQLIDTTSGLDTVTNGVVTTVGMRASNWKIPVPATTPQALTQPPPYSLNNITVADPAMRTPRTYMWGFSIQREVAKNTVFTLSYVGNHGVALYGGYDANQANYVSNGFLAAFQAMQAGNNSALIDSIVAGDSGRPGWGCGTACGAKTGLAYIKNYYQSYLDQNSVAGLASVLANRLPNGVTPLVVQSGLSPYFFKPFPQYLGGVYVLGTRDYSNYNGMIAQIERRFSNGLLFQGAFTWSKTQDVRSFDPAFTRVSTGSSQAATATPYDFHNPRLNYGPADFDRTRVFQANWVYELPFGKDKAFGAGLPTFMQHIVGGWQIAGNGVWESGRPITFVTGSNTFSSVVQTPASCTGECNPYVGHVYFNYSVNQQFYLMTGPWTASTNSRTLVGNMQSSTLFIPAAGQFSNLGRNYWRQPSIKNLNAVIAKSFRIREGHELQARLEMQNVTNSQMFDTFGSQSIQSTVFTRVNQSVDGVMNGGPRRMQLSAKYTF